MRILVEVLCQHAKTSWIDAPWSFLEKLHHMSEISVSYPGYIV